MFGTQDALSAVYSDEPMNTVVYHLHAVLVHQGQASGGHYWSYVRKPPSLRVQAPSQKLSGASDETQKISSVTQVATSSEVTMSSPATSTESGGTRGGEGEGGREKSDEKHEEDEEKESTEEGEGGGGSSEGSWLKFNDVSVHEVPWEEVVKESYGGHHNTSAYCLIYLSPLLHQSWATAGEKYSASLASENSHTIQCFIG